MILKYNLSENDYLQHQLYVASKTDRVKKKRQQSRVAVTLLFGSLAVLFLQTENSFLAYYFGGFAILSFVFYPLYLRRHYKVHYKEFIADTYKNRFGESITIIFNNDKKTLETHGITGTSKLDYSIFEEIIEISEHIFIKIRTGGSLIIPKRLENIDYTVTTLKQLASQLQIKYIDELNWKWK